MVFCLSSPITTKNWIVMVHLISLMEFRIITVTHFSVCLSGIRVIKGESPTINVGSTIPQAGVLGLKKKEKVS